MIMIGMVRGYNGKHSVSSVGSKCHWVTLMLPCALLWALEADVTLRDVMSVEYFTNPSTGSSFTIVGTCVSDRRRGIHSDSSRAMLPATVMRFRPGQTRQEMTRRPKLARVSK